MRLQDSCGNMQTCIRFSTASPTPESQTRHEKPFCGSHINPGRRPPVWQAVGRFRVPEYQFRVIGGQKLDLRHILESVKDFQTDMDIITSTHKQDGEM